jgi:hypothetical protein
MQPFANGCRQLIFEMLNSSLKTTNMKKTIFFSVLITCLLQFSATSFAQDASQTTGNFKIDQNGVSISANYTLAHALPDNIVLHIRPSSEFVLNAHIVDANGKEMIKLETQNVEGRYVNSIDVSKLAAGNYFVEILAATADQNYRIAFVKS